jgi:hypothetical protein
VLRSPLKLQKQWRHVAPRATTDEGNKTGGSGMSSSSLSSYAIGEGCCYPFLGSHTKMRKYKYIYAEEIQKINRSEKRKLEC